jgi:anthranilate synthase component 1
VPDNEWMETLNKARAVIRAAELAQAHSSRGAV